MIKTVSFILFTFCLTVHGQDSTYVKQFLNKNKFPAVDTMYYKIKYRAGKPKFEGWVIEEKAGTDAVLLKLEKPNEDWTSFHYFGIIKHYYPSGKIKGLDTNSFVNDTSYSIQYRYRRNNSIKSLIKAKSTTRVDNTSTTITSHLVTQPEDRTTSITYDRKGRPKRRYIYIGKKCISKESLDSGGG